MQLFEHFEIWIGRDQSRQFGEVRISQDSNGFRAIHYKDQDCPDEELEPLSTVQEVREWVKFDADGGYRPLKTAPTLKTGWLILDSDPQSFYSKIDAIYPAGFAVSLRYFEDELAPVSLRATLGRQTGMYRRANEISDSQANEIMRNQCAKGCLKQIAWPLDEKCEVSRLPNPGRRIPLICSEACTFVVSEAQRLARNAEG